MCRPPTTSFLFVVVALVSFLSIGPVSHAADHPYPAAAKETKAPPRNNWGNAEEQVLDQFGKDFKASMPVDEFITERKLFFERTGQPPRAFDAPSDIDGKWGPIGSSDSSGKFADPQEIDYQQVADLAAAIGFTTGTVTITHTFKQRYRVTWEGKNYVLNPLFTRSFQFNVQVGGPNPNPTPPPTPSPTPTPTPVPLPP